MKISLAILLIVLTAGCSTASNLWVNNITVNEHNMTWGYTETYLGADSIAFRMNIDAVLGDNDGFLNAWELLKADQDIRKKLRSSIDKEFDVRINNDTSNVEIIDIDSQLSQDLIGMAHNRDPVVNMYNVTYSLRDTIFNASSLWLLGQVNTHVTLVMFPGIDVINISGMNNVSVNISDHTEITGDFKEKSIDRGEITLDLARNASIKVSHFVINNTWNVSENVGPTNITKVASVLSRMRDATFIISGIVIIILIYVFKLRKNNDS
ncbi:MAG: hypothetical protein J5U19_09635 [Candidatus Methanoperedens sp.]|nr:hypothetical protein [Candidatus Methanoperedens sp.]